MNRTCEHCEYGEAVPLPKQCAPCIVHMRDNFKPKLRLIKDGIKFDKPWSRINGVYRIG